MDEHTREDAVARLRAWFRANRRELPWRREPRDPYAVWVSEVMLQQTQVDTVRPYFERFMTRWPTVADLAAAPVEDVMAAWRGLGYYARARNLHAAAQQVAAAGGEMPRDLDGLRGLRGVGRYTAAAIYSLACGGRAAVLDGNVARVLSRLYEVDGDVRAVPVQRRLWDLAETLVPGEGAGEVNEALMELGALVCVPGVPRCLLCPLRPHCAARRSGREVELPVPARRARQRTADFACAAVWRAGRILVVRRPPEGLLGGLWGLPGLELVPHADAADALRGHLAGTLGLAPRTGREYDAVRHVFTHIAMTFRPFEVTADGEPHAGAAYDGVRFVAPDEARALPQSRAMEKVLAVVLVPAPGST